MSPADYTPRLCNSIPSIQTDFLVGTQTEFCVLLEASLPRRYPSHYFTVTLSERREPNLTRQLMCRASGPIPSVLTLLFEPKVSVADHNQLFVRTLEPKILGKSIPPIVSIGIDSHFKPAGNSIHDPPS
jgi:hypothetical protein